MRESGQVVYVVADDPAPPEANHDAERSHVHQRVDQQINYQSDISVGVVRDYSEQQITCV